MHNRLVAIVTLLAALAASCSSAASSEGAAGGPPSELASVKSDEGNDEPEYDGPDSTYLFEQNRLHTFELTLADEALAFMDADPRAEEYVPAILSFGGEEFGEVGLRYKGSVGAFVGCLEETDPEPDGAKTCTKLSMKVKVNWDGSDARFYDLRKLQFHSQNRDASQMHERLGYWLFREMGVPAPRSVHARLIVNGEYIGLFAFTEQVDGRFARHHFDDGTGNIFKEVWPVDENGLAFHEAVLAGGLETNEEDEAAPLLRAFGEALEAATTDDELRTASETFLDVDQMMSLIAVDRAIANDDGPLHFYCFEACGNHNFYWYADPATRKLRLIPWDLDNAFENVVTDVNPVNPIADGWNETSHDCLPFAHGEAGFPQRSAACDPVFAGLALFPDEYRAAQERLLAGPFAEGVIEARLDEWSAQIASATTDASALHDDAVTLRDWHSAIGDLRDAIVVARSRLQAAVADG